MVVFRTDTCFWVYYGRKAIRVWVDAPKGHTRLVHAMSRGRERLSVDTCMIRVSGEEGYTYGQAICIRESDIS